MLCKVGKITQITDKIKIIKLHLLNILNPPRKIWSENFSGEQFETTI